MKNTDIQQQKFPNKPGIYIFKDTKKNILYIGKAKNIQKRIQQYFSPGSVRKQDMVNKAHNIEFLITESETEALQLEENLIKANKPPFNSLLRDNNRYVYIKCTYEPFPQIMIVKQRKNDKATYIGPKYHSRELRQFLHYFRQLFGYRGCKSRQFNTGKICSDYHFGLCKGRCNKEIIQQYQAPQQDYYKITKSIQSFFEGNTKKIEKEIQKQMTRAIQKNHFERAAKLRDMYYHIATLKEQQNVIKEPTLNGHIIKIHSIGNRWVYVILHFFEGKLIDTITNKQSMEDTNHDSLLATFQAEFGNNITCNGENTYSTNKLKKKFIKETTLLFQNILDSYLAQTSFQKENLMNELLLQIQKKYKLINFPYHIECIDISHFNGDRVSGGLSCFIGGVTEKKYYRRYKIQGINKKSKNLSNDYTALKEILTRRAKSNHLPDLIILDGGKGQLNILKELSQSQDKTLQKLFKHTEIIALGKGKARTRQGKQSGHNEIIYKFKSHPGSNGWNFQIKKNPLSYDQADHLLIQIRNEAHRFANNYRKKQMSKERKTK